MGTIEEYRAKLREAEDWDSLLMQESRLPGPRANLELAFAAALEGTREQLMRLAELDADAAPNNSPEGFLAFCGVLGIGYLAARGEHQHLTMLRDKACDSRWRIREAVALGLQKYGQRQIDDLLDLMAEWGEGNLLERRAAVASLCAPSLLSLRSHATRIVKILDSITASVLSEDDRTSEEFKVLRRGLGYGWSVAVAAQPSIGKPRMEKWIDCQDADIRWIMRQNLKKKRLSQMDKSWVKAQLQRLR